MQNYIVLYLAGVEPLVLGLHPPDDEVPAVLLLLHLHPLPLL